MKAIHQGSKTLMVECKDGVKRPRKSVRTVEEQKSDFWERVKIGGKDECWPWTGGVSELKEGRNYGVVWMAGVKKKTHRVAFEFTKGQIEKGLLVCHTCDNPICCNPNHLFQGTNLDNMRDCLSKGRGRKEHGEDRYNAKLTEDDVRQIRRRFVKRCPKNGLAALGREFGVYDTMIHSIVTRKRWKHVK